jgi:hypothetical protein
MRDIGRIAAGKFGDRLPLLCLPELSIQSARGRFRFLLLALLLVFPDGGMFSQQNSGMGGQFPNAGSFPSSSRGVPQDPNQSSPLYDPFSSSEAEKRLRMINAERQKSMVADTDKLVKLATELNEEIARSNSGALSASQLRKVAEIEKLAHNVRDKMVMSIRGPQLNSDGVSAPYFPPGHWAAGP